MADWIFSIVDRLGSVGVGLLILLENLIPPIPSEVVLPLAGFRSSTGALNVFAVWPAATVGAVPVRCCSTGWAPGSATTGCTSWPGTGGSSWPASVDIDRGHKLFDRHGGKVVLFARCVPFLRSVVSIPAGVLGMPLLRFTVLTAIGSGVWNGCSSRWAGGWASGGTRWRSWLGPVSYVVIGLLLVGLIVLIVRRLRDRVGRIALTGAGSWRGRMSTCFPARDGEPFPLAGSKRSR